MYCKRKWHNPLFILGYLCGIIVKIVFYIVDTISDGAHCVDDKEL